MAMSRIGWLELTFVLAVGIAVSALLYAPAWDCPYFADDYQYVGIGDRNPFSHFWSPYEGNMFYRPFAFLSMSVTQRFFQEHTWPLRALHYVLHAVLGLVVYVFARGIIGSKLGAWLSLVFLLVAQGAALGVSSNDTVTQLLGTTAGVAAIFVTAAFIFGRPRPESGSSRVMSTGAHAAVIGLLAALSLWSKESSVGMVAPVVLLLFWAILGRQVPARRVVPVLLTLCAVVIAYAVARSVASTAPLQFGDERYDLAVGAVTIRNVGLMLMASLSPMSTVKIHHAVLERELHTLAAAGGLLLAAGVLFLAGILAIRARSKGTAIAVPLAAVVVCFPNALQNHVSELYCYNCLPFVAVCMGAGAAWMLRRHASRRTVVTGLALVLLVGVSNALSANGKAVLIRRSGDRASALFSSLCERVARVEPGAVIGLIDVHDGPSYSLFVVSPFGLVGPDSQDDIRRVAGRPDVQLLWLEAGELRAATAGGMENLELLTCVGDAVVPYATNGLSPSESGE